jgi:RimJ/RimL family protein N-acetyltransferase
VIKLERMSVKFPELDMIADWRNQTMQTLRSNNLTAKGDSQRKWVESFGPTEAYYFIYDSDLPTKELLGYCGLDKIHPVHNTAEISLLIRPDCLKSGYGRETIRQLLKIGFGMFNLKCIFGEIIDSSPSWEFWAKQRFVLEGQLRMRFFKDSVYYGSKVGSITRNEWRDK